MEQLSAVEIATKRRYLFLLGKVRADKTLSTGELKELQQYEKERMAKKTTTETKITVKKTTRIRRKQSTAKNKRAKTKKNESPISAAQIKLLAMAAESMVAASADIEIDIAELCKKYKTIDAAWLRGRFLKNLAQLAQKIITIADAETELEIPAGQLEKILTEDKEAADIWNQNRLQTRIKVKTALLAAVENANPTALRQIDRLLSHEVAKQGVDYTHVSISQMVEITGRHRKTIHEWFTKFNCPRNADKTFNIREFLNWFEEFTLKKATPGKPVEQNSLAARKAQKLDIELKEKVGYLLDRNSTMAGLVGRHQLMLNLFDKMTDKLPDLMRNQPPERIKKILTDSFAEIRNEMATSQIELKLNEHQKTEFNKFIESL